MNLHQITLEIIGLMKDSLLWKNLKRGCLGLPTAWDINCGYCEEWAELAKSRYGGETFWLDEIDLNFGEDGLDIGHCVYFLEGRYYDSQHPEGVTDLYSLDIVKRVTREEFLSRSSE